MTADPDRTRTPAPGPASARFAFLPLAAAGVYLLVPGYPEVVLHGIPLGLSGSAVLAALIAAAWWTRSLRVSPRDARLPIWLLALAIAGRVLLTVSVPHAGWVARYYAND